MDLQQIKYFLAVVDCGTFLAAAKQVHVSQPTLSAGIRKLEESLDVTLFERGSRAATLTAAGQQFLAPARQAYNQLLTARASLRQQPTSLQIGVQANIHMDHVAQIISLYRTANPHIVVECVVESPAVLAQKLKRGVIDIVIANSLVPADGFIPLFDERLCIVAARHHPLARQRTLSLSALDRLPFIERMNCSFWQDVSDAFNRDGIVPQTVMQVESDEFVLSLVAENLAVSIITDRVTPYDVCFIPLDDIRIDRQIGICCNDDAAAHVAEFRDRVIDHYRV